MLFGLRPIETAWRWQRRFGNIFTVKLLPTGPFAYVVDPDAARSIFSADQSQLHAGESNQMLEPVNGANSVVVLDDARHVRARKLLLPLFRPSRIAKHRALIERIVEREIETWPLGRQFALAPRMQDVALEVIVRTTMGDDDRIVDPLKKLLPRLLRLNTLTWLPGLGRDLGPLSPVSRLRRLTAKVDEVLYGEIKRRRATRPASDASSLDYLLTVCDGDRSLSDVELRDHLATLLLSGHETTSSSLAWAFERLLRSPLVMARLRAELQNEKEGQYLDAVVKEVLRSRPAVMDTGRVMTEEYSLAGWTLPLGSQARVAISMIHQHPDLFQQPDQFRPERFLNGEVNAGDWMPFGGGARRCLGASLAMFEMKVVVATVVRRVVLRPVQTQSEPAAFRAPHLTLSPARGCRVIVERRLPSTPE